MLDDLFTPSNGLFYFGIFFATQSQADEIIHLTFSAELGLLHPQIETGNLRWRTT